MHVPDKIDMKILRALQADGRLTNAELASRVNISAATCHRRTHRLLSDGYITGIKAQIAPVKVGLGALVMVGVVLDRSTPESFAAFEGAVMVMKEVLECNLVAGDFDYLLKIRVRDMAAPPGTILCCFARSVCCTSPCSGAQTVSRFYLQPLLSPRA